MAETSERVRCTFFGTSSLYLTDGTTGIFIDAFLTRPSLSTLEHEPIKPDIDLIKRVPRRVCIVSGPSKVHSLRGALAAGLITDLIVDEGTARALVQLTQPLAPVGPSALEASAAA